MKNPFGIAPLPAGLSAFHPAVLLATGFGSGRLAPAPGTWGTLAAWLLALCMPKIALCLGISACVAAGYWSITKMEAKSGIHDASMIVIDEWAGIWITMLFVPAANMPLALLAFFAFRFFDVLKPWPIGWLDKNIDGPTGVMLDDVVAGLFAGLCVWGAALCLSNL